MPDFDSRLELMGSVLPQESKHDKKKMESMFKMDVHKSNLIINYEGFRKLSKSTGVVFKSQQWVDMLAMHNYDPPEVLI